MTRAPAGSTAIAALSLTHAERAHCERVLAAIRAAIRTAGGWLPFDRFMELALYAPGLGYYSAGSAKLGAGGDFATAPEISSLFSRCVARQCAEILAQVGHAPAAPGNGCAATILELGAGTGRMAADILVELERLQHLPAQYQILEVSADLRERQQLRIAELPAHLAARVVWLDALPPKPVDGVILANEVLDALPCTRFVIGATLLEVGVEIAPESAGAQVAEGAQGTRDVGGAALRMATRLAEGAVHRALAAVLADLPEILPAGYVSELCPRADAWIRALAEALGRGALLLFDYGLPRTQYYHPARGTGTLRCHFKHHVHDDPLLNVGVQDITAWVDFTRVAEAAHAAGLDVAGFVTQAAFLLGTGIEADVAAAQGMQQLRLSGEAQRLLLPGEMGEAFKAMALTRGLGMPLSGFALQDLRRSL